MFNYRITSIKGIGSLFLFCIIGILKVNAQCTGGSSAGSITPTSTFQTRCIQGGQYRTFSATAGVYYLFTFCQGGASTTFDTEITILDNAGVAVPGAFNDDNCGTSSELMFLAPSTATYRVLITKYHCGSDATCQTLAYKSTTPPNDETCSATYIYGNGCSCSYTTYGTTLSTNSPQSSPPCGNFIPGTRDVWFATKATSSGDMVFTTQAGSITDAAMAVYKGNCGGPLTLIGCNDDKSGSNYMPELNLSGLTPGDSLFIRIWTYNDNQAGTFGLCVYDATPYYCMSGQASEMNPTNCLQITPNKQGQIGCIWNTTQLDMAADFDYTYTVNLGNDPNGADGLTFTLQNSPAGTSACGSSGYQLASSPIPNSIRVEFDTFFNGAGVSDIPEDHIAISTNGNIGSPVAGPIQASSTSAEIEDGLDHTVRVTWNSSTNTFSVYFDGVFRLAYTNNLVANIFNSNNMVYWGFTGSTGAFTNTQSICPGNLPGAPLPVTWLNVDAYALNNNAFIKWSTAAEENINRFILERSHDGIVFTVVEDNIRPSSNGVTSNEYLYTDYTPLPGKSYYRVKEVDNNGDEYYSTIRSVDLSNYNDLTKSAIKLFPNPTNTKLGIIAQVNKDGQLEVYDNLGKLVLSKFVVKGENNIHFNDNQITAGMYTCILKSEDSVSNSTMVVLD